MGWYSDRPRPVGPQDIVVGDASFYFCKKCNQYVDAVSHNPVEVKVTSLDDELNCEKQIKKEKT